MISEAEPIFSGNIRRLRTSKGLTQQQLADLAEISRIALRDIETGKTREPRVNNLQSIAQALSVNLMDLLAEPPRLKTARFRSRKLKGRSLAQREEIVFWSARRLKDFIDLEERLQDRRPYTLANVTEKAAKLSAKNRGQEAAALTRAALKLDDNEPIRNICGLLESAGIKVCLLSSDLDGFFGLSAQDEGGPVIVVNTAEQISVERQIFTTAHELGHLLLHPGAYDTTQMEENEKEEKQADAFAGHFLMPPAAFEKQLQQTSGLPFVDRVLHIKRIFRVSYKAVLHRLIELGLVADSVWKRFSFEYKQQYGKTLSQKEEPFALVPVDFLEDRLSRIVRQAVEREEISLSRAAEILGMNLQAMRERATSWRVTA